MHTFWFYLDVIKMFLKLSPTVLLTVFKTAMVSSAVLVFTNKFYNFWMFLLFKIIFLIFIVPLFLNEG